MVRVPGKFVPAPGPAAPLSRPARSGSRGCHRY